MYIKRTKVEREENPAMGYYNEVDPKFNSVYKCKGGAKEGVHVRLPGKDGEISTSSGTRLFLSTGQELQEVVAYAFDEQTPDAPIEIWVNIVLLSIGRSPIEERATDFRWGGIHIVLGGKDGELSAATGTQVYTQDKELIAPVVAFKMPEITVDNILTAWIKLPILSIGRGDVFLGSDIKTDQVYGVEPVTE